MTSVSRRRRRARSLLLAPLAALATLLTACSDKPPIAPDQAPLRSAAHLSQQPMAGEPNPIAQPSLRRLEGAAAIMAATAFTAAPFAADFVVTGAENGTGAEHYFPSNGDGTFASKSDILGLGNVDGMDVADLDGDGDNDFLACDGNTGETYLYANNGSGSFAPSVVATGITATGFCTNLRIADFNQDGRNDFVVGDNSLTNGMFVYLQSATGTFSKVASGLDVATWSTGSNAIFGLATGDVDRDGHQDALVLGYNGAGAGQVRFYKGDGTGAMAASVLLFNVNSDFSTSSVVGLALFDLEVDGDLDIVVGGGSAGDHYVYTNNGSGSFTKPSGLAFDVDGQTGIDAFDVDADGDHDLLVAAFGPHTLYLVRNQGGSLATPVSVAVLSDASIGVGAPSTPTLTNETTQRVEPEVADTVAVEQDGNGDGVFSPVVGVDIPAQTFSEPVDVTVRIVDVTSDAKCHDFLLGQFGKCVEITATNADDGTEATLNNDVVVGVCLPSDLSLEMYKFESPQGRALPLKQVAADFLNCADLELASAAPRNWLEGLAMGVSKRVGEWIAPKSLWAADAGFGGTVHFDDGFSFFTWASPIQVAHAGLAINLFNSGEDGFGVTGIFDLRLKNFPPFPNEAGFDAAVHPVTVAYGNYVETIPLASFKFSAFRRRFVYVKAATIGIAYMDIDATTGAFLIAGRAPTQGDALPTFREFTVQIGHRTQGGGLSCGTDGKCRLHH